MYIIHDHFPGANIRVISQTEEEAIVDVDLRDTVGDWFYWCFCVRGAAGQVITFRFPSPHRVGYYGAAVSHNYLTWQFQYKDRGHEGNSFTYAFAENENEVFFAHDILYRPEQFSLFAERNGLQLRTLCTTEKERKVPYVEFGEGKETILLTARHHACESTGNYVLEGVLDRLKQSLARKYTVLCVPFVDYDGVYDGDQGKNRNGQDHNRDYTPGVPSRYVTTAALRTLTSDRSVRYAFDFHSPWHLSGINDKIHIPIKGDESMVERVALFSSLWENILHDTPSALPYYAKDNLLPGQNYNVDSPTCAAYYAARGASLAFTVETPYFLVYDTPYSPSAAYESGRAFADALIAFDAQ